MEGNSCKFIVEIKGKGTEEINVDGKETLGFYLIGFIPETATHAGVKKMKFVSPENLSKKLDECVTAGSIVYIECHMQENQFVVEDFDLIKK
jgi:hypothetical protein